ncbi:hypothetical protein RB195_024106 [Necator americanus]|uniref:Fork-head domain-containing protein n=1 Tax=Necator americanus TaxID=51031 RepID=A0ABR1ELV4_NECAM
MDFISISSTLRLSHSLSNDEEVVLSRAEAPRLESIERPSLSYKDLIIEAIESSPGKRLKLNEIYQVIRLLHPYYRHRPDQWGWQNSIRHNLSLHDCFVKLPLKQTSASGVVGHFWTVVPESSDKQTLRRRSRAPNRNGNRAKTSDSVRETCAVREDVICFGDIPKPTASYRGMENILGDGYKAYGQSLLSAYLYQHGLLNSLQQQLVEMTQAHLPSYLLGLNPLLLFTQLRDSVYHARDTSSFVIKISHGTEDC